MHSQVIYEMRMAGGGRGHAADDACFPTRTGAPAEKARGRPAAAGRPGAECWAVRFFPTRARGQNFLHDRSVAERFAAAVLRSGGDSGTAEAVVEIGPGKGAITFPLIEAGARVLAVEFDSRLAAVLAERAKDRGVSGRLRIVVGDARRFDFAAAIREFGARPPVPVCGNLPFSQASRLLLRLVDASIPGSGAAFDRLTLTLQREVALRVVAPSGGRAYGALSVVVQQAVIPEILFLIHPAAFRPRPRVVAAVVGLTPRPEPLPVGDRRRFRSLVRGLFLHRRKTMKNAVAGLPDPALRRRAAGALVELGLDPDRRPEQLSVAEFAALARRSD